MGQCLVWSPYSIWSLQLHTFSLCIIYSSTEVPGGLNLLLLDAVLDGLRVDQLLQLLLLGDQQVVLVGSSLGGHRVVTGSNVLSIDSCDREGSRALGNLGLLPVLSLLRGGVKDGSNRGAVHNWHGEVC